MTGAVRYGTRNDWLVVFVCPGESSFLEWAYRLIHFPAAGLRENVEPFLFCIQGVESIFEFSHSTASLGYGNGAEILYEPVVLCHQLVSENWNPYLPPASCSHHRYGIPTINVVADCDGPVLELVLAHILLTLHLHSVLDIVHKRTEKMSNCIIDSVIEPIGKALAVKIRVVLIKHQIAHLFDRHKFEERIILRIFTVIFSQIGSLLELHFPVSDIVQH